MSKVDMSRRVGVLMSTKAVLALSNDNRQAFIKAVGQADSMTDLNSEFAGVIEAAEKELMAKGYVRDGKGRLLPPGAMAEQGHKEAKGPIIVALKGSSKSGNYGHAGIPGHQGGSTPKGKGAVSGAAAPDIKAQKRDLQKQLNDLTNQIAMASGNETARLHREITAVQKKIDNLGKAKPAAKPAAAPAKGVQTSTGGLFGAGVKYDVRDPNEKLSKPSSYDSGTAVRVSVPPQYVGVKGGKYPLAHGTIVRPATLRVGHGGGTPMAGYTIKFGNGYEDNWPTGQIFA